MSYTLRDGSCSDSLALHTARLSGVPPPIVARAAELLAAAPLLTAPPASPPVSPPAAPSASPPAAPQSEADAEAGGAGTSGSAGSAGVAGDADGARADSRAVALDVAVSTLGGREPLTLLPHEVLP